MPIFRRWPVAPRLAVLALSSAVCAASLADYPPVLSPGPYWDTPGGGSFGGAPGRPRFLYFGSCYLARPDLSLVLCGAAPWFERNGIRLVSWFTEACWMPWCGLYF